MASYALCYHSTAMRILTLILLLTVSVSAVHNFSGRATDQYGRAVRGVTLRLQRNYCEPDFAFTPVYETYTATNTFGYYTFQGVPAVCLSYSIRVLGSSRYPESGFFPGGYFYGFHITDYSGRDFEGQDFQFTKGARRWIKQ